MKRSVFSIVALLVVLSMLLAACGATEAPPEPTKAPEAAEPTEAAEVPEGDLPYAGEKVVIFSTAGEEQAAVFEQNFVDFEERTGIDFVVDRSGDFETLSVVRS